MHKLEFFFDCSSPWTYLAFERVLTMFSPTELEIEWKPILVGGVFNTVNPSVYANREAPVPAKLAYQKKDLQDWARLAGITIGEPPVFPVNSVKAMRAAFFALEHDRLVPFARNVFRRYWGELADISRDDELRAIAEASGLNPDECLAAAAAPDYKNRLRETTDELIRRGGFGSPTMYLDGNDMYFGNDRLEMIRARIDAAR